ncbi:MAG: hypothetical protein WEB59_08350 [Thermoanaerobaculia bacterium]
MPALEGSWNGGTAIAVTTRVTRRVASRHQTDMFGKTEKPRNARVSHRSVFDVNGARLAIGHFNRPLAADECSLLTRVWEHSGLPEVEDFEVSDRQVSFLTRPPKVDATWRSIESLLAASPSLAKAS